MMKREFITAYHEAGHAVAAHTLGIEIESASIVPDSEGHFGGRVSETYSIDELRYQDDADEDEVLENTLVMIMAGVAAVEILTGHPTDSEEPNMDSAIKGSDWDHVADLVLSLAGPDENRQLALFDLAQGKAKTILREKWAAVEALAEALLKYRTLTTEQVQTEIREGPIQRQRGEA